MSLRWQSRRRFDGIATGERTLAGKELPFDTNSKIADNQPLGVNATSVPTVFRYERLGMIKAIFFDYDGVLTTDKTGSLTTNRYLSKMAAVEYEAVRKAFSKYNQELLVGKVTHREIWDAACEAMHSAVDFSLLEQAFLSTPANDAMLALARRLKSKYALGIITDNKKDRIDCLRRSQGLDALFNPIVVSAEFGSGKDSAAVFEYALRCLAMRPEESIFIDNNPENLIAPKALGMGVIFHDDEKNDVDKLVTMLTEEFHIRLD